MFDPFQRLPALRPFDPFRRVWVPRDLATVTRVGDETPGIDVGLPSDAVERIWSEVEDLYRQGIHPAIALCLRRDGEVVLDRTIGHVRGNGPTDTRATPKEVATPATPFCIASASKAVTAMVVHLLDQRGELHVGDRVAEYVPEFAVHGKDTITIDHVLSHRSGVPNIPPEALDLDHIDDVDYINAILFDAEPVSRPGRWVAYHAVSGGFILAEVVRRVTGRGIDEVLQTEILDPLGFDTCGYGIEAARIPEVAVNAATGFPVMPPASWLLERALGLPFDDVTTTLNDPRFLTGVVPAANIVATANDLSRFFELLRVGGTLDGVEVFEPRTVRRAISEQSYLELDLTFGVPSRYGLGFMLGNEVWSLYGPHTEHAFGHLGFSNVLGWADPARGLSGALLTSGKAVVGPHLIPLWQVMRRIASVTPRDRLDTSPIA